MTDGPKEFNDAWVLLVLVAGFTLLAWATMEFSPRNKAHDAYQKACAEQGGVVIKTRDFKIVCAQPLPVTEATKGQP